MPPIRIFMPLHPVSLLRNTCLFAAVAGASAAHAVSTVPGNVPASTGLSGGAAFVQVNPTSEMLHVTLGHTMFLNTATRLKRVYISNPAVLGSFTASPTQVLLTAKNPGVSSLVIWDDSGRSSVYTVSSDVDVDGLRTALTAAFPHAKIDATPAQDRVTLTGVVATQDEADAAVKLASSYAKEVADSLQVTPSHTKQVQLKVRIAEVDRTKAQQWGFNFISGGATNVVAGTGQFASTSISTLGQSVSTATVSNPLNLLLYNSSANIGAAIADLEQKQVMQILAEPTITSLSGQTASFLSGGEFPFPVVQGGTGGFTSVTIQFRPYGVKLEFTPYVNPDGTIRLKVAPEVSALDYTNEVVISGYDIPAIDTRRAQTEVELKDGQSFAISGLLDHRLNDAFSTMPGIASIPILGQLFRSKNNTASTTELMVIVTPQIVDPLNAPLPVPPLPKESKPYMNNQQFDQQLTPKKKKKNQGPPPPLPQQP